MISLSIGPLSFYRYLMPTIGQLLKYLTILNPQGHPVRMALYNYMTNMQRSDQLLTAEVLNTFFNHALEYPHWSQDRKNFGQEAAQIIEQLLQQIESNTSLDLSAVIWPQQMQIIDIENFSDFTETVHAYLTKIYTDGEKFRLVSDQQKKLIAVVLFPNGKIQVRIFDRKMTLREGLLQPLKLDISLTYQSGLELFEGAPQKLDLGSYTYAQFEMIDDQVVGSAVRGYLFQKYQDFRGGGLRDNLKLFYPVKRLEQYFVDRRTDTFYLELMEAIETTSNLLKMRDPSALKNTPAILAHAEAAFEQVFVGDKLLGLLIRDLQNLWHSKQTPQKFV